MERNSYRDTWVEVSLDAIHYNVKAFNHHIGRDTKLMAVVKADGYGHGAIEVAKEAIKAGADYLAVAILDEALQLRKAGIELPILVLGYTSTEGVSIAIEQNITLTVFTEDVAKKIKSVAEAQKKLAHVHLKMETGMNRIGISSQEEAFKMVNLLSSNYVMLEGAFTHFADADNTDSTYTEKQFASFIEMIDYLEQHEVKIPIKHCCNSAGTIAYPNMHLDMVRVGVSLYGLYPGDHLREIISLKQAMSLKTKAVYIKQLEANNTISYGRTFTTKQKSKIATIPIGYADGFSRSLSNQGHVTVKGRRAPIIGRICMDQAMIDVSDMEHVGVKDEITIFGDPGDGFISLGEVAEQMNTIHYETACLIGKRVPRKYVKTTSNKEKNNPDSLVLSI
ncbi:alanine racemase [Oceanobacillus senegalensis]|uniref:alanine racemase n=1 Tax=Oceanobacillus senegalensis TaxID=1936063 RepID=UPI000A30B2EC|nr:alanine racemase [Oceanobacillus senegalensis]